MSRFRISLWKVTSRQPESCSCRPATAMGEGCQASRWRGPGGAWAPAGAAGALAGAPEVRAPATSAVAPLDAVEASFAVAAVVHPSVASADVASSTTKESLEIRWRLPVRDAIRLCLA